MRKSKNKHAKIEGPRLLWERLGTSWSDLGAIQAFLGSVLDLHWRHFEVFGVTLERNYTFLEMYEKPKEDLGFSRVSGGPGAQVEATWATKSCPRGVRTAKMTSKSTARGLRAAKVGPSVQSCCRSYGNGAQFNSPQRSKSI